MHIVEIRRGGDDMAGPMNQMRTWLDGRSIEPVAFRMSVIPGGTVFLVELQDVREAAALARALGGKIIHEHRDHPAAA
jgi:hypothetical protein